MQWNTIRLKNEINVHKRKSKQSMRWGDKRSKNKCRGRVNNKVRKELISNYINWWSKSVKYEMSQKQWKIEIITDFQSY